MGLQIIPGYMPGEGNGSWKRPLLSQWQPLQDELVPDATFARWYGPDGKYVGARQHGPDHRAVLAQRLRHRPRQPQEPCRAGVVERGAGGGEQRARPRDGGAAHRRGRHPEAVPGARRASWCRPSRPSIGVDIRGQGGFAVLPPSLHESGQHYDWLPGRAPWEIAIEVAPAWLLEAIADLAEAHGGDPVNDVDNRPLQRDSAISDIPTEHPANKC